MFDEINKSSEVDDILKQSIEIAKEHRNSVLVPIHILLGILKKYYYPDSPVDLEDPELFLMLKGSALSESRINKLRKVLLVTSSVESLLPLDFEKDNQDFLGGLLKEALKEATSLRVSKVNTRILLLTIWKTDSVCKDFLENSGISEGRIIDDFGTRFLQELSNSLSGFINSNMEENNKNEKKTTSTDEQKELFLEQYATCLNTEAKDGKLDPVFGRTKELQKLIEILCCRKKNNAVLIGDPGVGKSSVIELLAQMIVEEKVPKYLLGKRIFSLDLNSLLSGTIYRGQYEERLEKIIKEVTTRDDIIIYIDEFHNLVGNGSSGGNGDAANILKPYLAKGQFQCIGATTIDEYRKFIEKDGALKRRFQEVLIVEPTEEETIDILQNIKEKYSAYHGVTYNQDVIKRCVTLASRYVSDRKFPDKAIDILDLAGSKIKVSQDDQKAIDKIKKELKAAAKKKESLVVSQKYEEAAKVRDLEDNLQKELNRLTSTEPAPEDQRLTLTVDLIDKTVSEMTGIPIEKLSKNDLDRLRQIRGVMESKIIGQSEAIKEVTGSLQRNSLGLRDLKRPIASFLLVGPTGTGKTYLCKTLAEEFFGSEDNLIRIDCSTLGEKSSYSALAGTSAGYVGYDDTPIFDKVKRKPYSVVLFDEIEKSSPEIRQSLLSILDDGYVTLGNNSRVDFKNTIIIFTGNVGTKSLQLHGDGVGFSKDSDKKKTSEAIVKKEIAKVFSPEFLNRLTGTVIFNTLSHEDMIKITDLELVIFEERLKEKGFSGIQISQEVKDKIISGCDLKFGARDLKREFIKYIEKPLAEKLLSEGEPKKEKLIKMTLQKDSEEIKVVFSQKG